MNILKITDRQLMYTLTHFKQPPLLIPVPYACGSTKAAAALARVPGQQLLPQLLQGHILLRVLLHDLGYGHLKVLLCDADTLTLSKYLLFSLVLCPACMGLLAQVNAHALHSATLTPGRVTDISDEPQAKKMCCNQ